MTTLTVNLGAGPVPLELPAAYAVKVAGASAAKAQAWAEGTLPGGAGTKSAKEHAEAAATAADGQLALCEAEADRSEDAAALAAAAAAEVTVPYAGSLLFLCGNGERENNIYNGLLELPSAGELLKTTTAGDDPMFGIGSGDAWGCVVKIPVEQYRGRNRLPVLWGTGNAALFGTGEWGVQFTPEANNTTANKRTFYARVAQGSAGGAVRTAQCPEDFSGFGYLQLYESAGNLVLEFTDWVTGDKTTGSVALSSGFGGKTTTNRLSIGGLRPADFPTDINADWSNATTCAMCSDIMMRDFAFMERKLTDAEIEDLRDGTPLTSILLSSEIRLYAPLASNGVIDLSIESRKAAVAALSLIQLGNVGAGSSLVGQSATKHLRLGYVATPATPALEFNADAAYWAIPVASEAGLTGPKEVRITSKGQVIKDWTPVDEVTIASVKHLVVYVPEFPGEGEVQVRSAGDPEIIAVINRAYPNVHLAPTGQSECYIALVSNGRTGNAWNNATSSGGFTDVPENFILLRRAGSLDTGRPIIVCDPVNPSFYGAGALAAARDFRAKDKRNLVMSILAVSGTGRVNWVNDADSDRDADNDIAVAGLISNRSPDGAIPVTVFIDSCWEADDGGLSATGPQFDTLVYPAWLRGIPTTALATVDRWLYDGTFTTSAAWAVVPSARFGTGTVQNSDSHIMADTRAAIRRSAAAFGGYLGPEPTPMLWENDALLGHHPLANSEQGDIFVSRCIMEAALVALGKSSYRPVSWGSYQLVDGNTAAIVTLSPALPGELRANDGSANIVGFEATLTTAGGRSRNNVSSAVVLNGAQVRVNLASAATPGQFQLWYHSGGPGDYGDAVFNPIWVNGAAMFNGWPVIGGNTAIPAAV